MTPASIPDTLGELLAAFDAAGPEPRQVLVDALHAMLPAPAWVHTNGKCGARWRHDVGEQRHVVIDLHADHPCGRLLGVGVRDDGPVQWYSPNGQPGVGALRMACMADIAELYVKMTTVPDRFPLPLGTPPLQAPPP